MLHICIPVTYQEHYKAQHKEKHHENSYTHTHTRVNVPSLEATFSQFFLQSVFNIYFIEKCDTGFQGTVKFGTGHLHIILLSICEFHEHKHEKGCTFLLT